MMNQGVVEAEPAEELLQIITEGTAAATGADFFRSLVCCLAMALRVHYAFVTECTDVTMTRVRTLAFVQRSAGASPRGGGTCGACVPTAGEARAESPLLASTHKRGVSAIAGGWERPKPRYQRKHRI